MKIIITAGATWVKIDDIRIITAKFTGKTGLSLARMLKDKGNTVTLVINDHCLEGIKTDGLKIISYRYYDELKASLLSELNKNRYDAVIHNAAVSDYKVKDTIKGKIPSGRESVNLELIPTEKIIKLIRELAPVSLVIQFKLEITQKDLLEKAYLSLQENNSDFVVANSFDNLKDGYKASIISREKQVIEVSSMEDLADNLDRLIRLLSFKK